MLAAVAVRAWRIQAKANGPTTMLCRCQRRTGPRLPQTSVPQERTNVAANRPSRPSLVAVAVDATVALEASVAATAAAAIARMNRIRRAPLRGPRGRQTAPPQP